MAWVRVVPHISTLGCRLPQKLGRSGLPKSLQRRDSSSCTHDTPAGLPLGMPGIGDVIDGAMQQAAQRSRHCMLSGDTQFGTQLGNGSFQGSITGFERFNALRECIERGQREIGDRLFR
jgi:hypothetical protein